MYELENLMILIVISPLFYLSLRFLWHMDKMRAKAFNDAFKEALHDSNGTET